MESVFNFECTFVAFLWVYWFLHRERTVVVSAVTNIGSKVKDSILIHFFSSLFSFFYATNTHTYTNTGFNGVTSSHFVLIQEICVNCMMMNIVQLHVLNLLPPFFYTLCFFFVSSTCIVKGNDVVTGRRCEEIVRIMFPVLWSTKSRFIVLEHSMLYFPPNSEEWNF